MKLDLIIDTDGLMSSTPDTSYSLNPVYSQLDGEFEQMIEAVSTSNKTIDGRWMLAAQHLESWRCLWTPHLSEHLPSLQNLMTWLIGVENKLAES
jgi:shikimate 5-dehydrogenase